MEYVFTDKTGTLTQNVMEFKRASVGGKVLDLESAREAVARRDPGAVAFFRLLSVCHTVVPDVEGESQLRLGVQCPAYEAESPDEAALVQVRTWYHIAFCFL